MCFLVSHLLIPVSTCSPFCPLFSVVSPSEAQSLFPLKLLQPQVEPWYQPAQPTETEETMFEV